MPSASHNELVKALPALRQVQIVSPSSQNLALWRSFRQHPQTQFISRYGTNIFLSCSRALLQNCIQGKQKLTNKAQSVTESYTAAQYQRHMRFMLSELLITNNFALHSFNQNYFTSKLRITFLQAELLYINNLLQAELLYINNFALHSFKQNYFTSTTSHYIPSSRTTLHQQLRRAVLQAELLYINNFALPSFKQNYFTSTTTQDSTSSRNTLHQQLRITFLQTELLYIKNYARQSFKQNYFTSTNSHYIPSSWTTLHQQLASSRTTLHQQLASSRTTLHQQLRITFPQAELLYINNYARQSFNQYYFTSTTSHYIPSSRTTLHQQLRKTVLQSVLLYINNFALHSYNQKHLIQTASHFVTWSSTTLQQQFHFLLRGQAFRTALDHVTLRDCCSRRQEPSDTLVSQSVHSQQSVRTSL